MGPWVQRLNVRELQIGLHRQCWGQAELQLIPCSCGVSVDLHPGNLEKKMPHSVIQLILGLLQICTNQVKPFAYLVGFTTAIWQKKAKPSSTGMQRSKGLWEMVKGALVQARHLKPLLSTQKESAWCFREEKKNKIKSVTKVKMYKLFVTKLSWVRVWITEVQEIKAEGAKQRQNTDKKRDESQRGWHW